MIIVPYLNLHHIKMQKAKLLKNPGVHDKRKITSKLSTYDMLN